mmetsp:Transcript_1496/g.3099  ORF Transcript_1496/g.3099 Transcript_1496/m.3099 type:complete len:91 (-) Transcript_1496:166-438(-)
MRSFLWSNAVCNPLPGWNASFSPIGSTLKFDPANPTAPVLTNFDPACTLYPDVDEHSYTLGPGLWGPAGSDSGSGGLGGSGGGTMGADVS